MRISKAIDTFLDYQQINSKQNTVRNYYFFYPASKKNMAV